MFKYYNANPLGRNVNDCSVRAIACATGKTWYETYDELSSYAREKAITFSEVEFINNYLADRYERFCPDRQKIHTVQDFLDLQLQGTYLITMSNHITCVIDGTLYDTFDCRDKLFWCIYKIRE